MKGLLGSLAIGAGALVLVLGIGAALFALTFSDPCETVVHREAVAPSGREKLVVYGRHCGSIATVTTTSVAVGPLAMVDPTDDEGGDTVFHARVEEDSPLQRGGYGPNVVATWRGDSLLVVRYDPRVEVLLAVVRTQGLTIRYDTLP